jgi:hypothetical protein
LKRDMDLVRKIVLAIEDHPHGYAPDRLDVEGYTQGQIGYHLYLMVQAGLIEGVESSNLESDSPGAKATCLTWAGHEFAAAARSEGIWAQAKKGIKEKIGSASMTVITQYLQSLAKSALGF